MSLAPGVRLSGYEIIALIGAGGMGEVYRARDTRLHREVALKLLPPQADDPAAVSRFEREARAVAALSHPNILAVYDVGQTDTASYVVFELLDGQTLRTKLIDGALPLRKAIDIARQVADGLAAAHARGITHRDIKPDNLFLTDDGRVKILDFGLAQMAPPITNGVAQTMVSEPLTAVGMVLGTMGYMAPEQVRGLAVDARADIFALGAVLYEMCTGTPAFKGATAVDTVTAVLSTDPPELTLVGQPTPPALDRVVRRCLEKSPGERFQSARDLSFALDALSTISGTPDAGATRVRTGLPWWAVMAGAVALAVAAGMIAARLWSAAPVNGGLGPLLRMEFDAPATSVTSSLLIAVSPDGRYLVQPSPVNGATERQLLVRNLGTGQSTTVPDSAGAWAPAWSPRSDALVFAQGSQLRRFNLADRATTPVTAIGDTFRGAVWMPDDTIVFSSRLEGVRRVAVSGGAVTAVLSDPTLDITLSGRIGDSAEHVLALRTTAAGAGDRHVVAIRVSDGTVTEVVANDAMATYAAPGYLLLPRPTGLFALQYDTATHAVSGDAIFLAEPVVWDTGSGISTVSASDAGIIAFLPGRDALVQFAWMDIDGQPAGLVEPPAFYSSFALSPDGTQIVARQLVPGITRMTPGLTIIDIARGVASPVPTPPGAISDPIWSADGRRILYRLDGTLVAQSPYADARETLRDERMYPDAMSRDGRWLLIGMPRIADRGFGLFVLPTEGEGTRQAVSDGPYDSDEGTFSPDGRAIAYHSDQTGQLEVYAARFPLSQERWQISSDGGAQPRWSSDGRALYYVDLAGFLTRVAVPADGPARAGRPQRLFDLGIGTPSGSLEQYAVHGDRVLVLKRSPQAAPQTVAVLANWTRALAAAGDGR